MTAASDRAAVLTEQRRPFVHAMVVRAQEPTSARPGDDAVILSDGSIEGFVGGQCAESSVRAAALETLRDGQTLLLRVLPDGSESFPETPGAQVVVNPCLSGGAIEIFLRPILPPPLVRVIGDSPIASAVADLAGFLGYTVARDGTFEGASAVVVAGLGKGEQDGLRAALDAGVGYIALVASPKRGPQVLDELGLTDEERARIDTPAGVWIGARTPPEIALSIMASAVQRIRLSPASVAAPPAASAPASSTPVAATESAIDPVCGMTVVITPDALHAVVDGTDQWFCGPGCLTHFTAAA